MKGYLRVKSVAGMEQEKAELMRRDYSKTELLIDLSASPEGMGWIPLSTAIKQGNVLKISAVRHNTSFEARFDMTTVGNSRSNGGCQIRGGAMSCVGTFVEVTRVPCGPESRLCFVCHSSSGDGRSLLK